MLVGARLGGSEGKRFVSNSTFQNVSILSVLNVLTCQKEEVESMFVAVFQEKHYENACSAVRKRF